MSGGPLSQYSAAQNGRGDGIPSGGGDDNDATRWLQGQGLGDAISMYRGNGSFCLQRYAEAKADLEKSRHTNPHTGTTNPGTSALVASDDAPSDGRRDVRLVYLHDALQMRLIPLCSLLRYLKDRALSRAGYSGIILAITSLSRFGYPRVLPSRQQNASLSDAFSLLFGLSSVYFVYRTAMWSLVYLHWKTATGLKRRLDDGKIRRQDMSGLEGWTWTWVEFYAGTF